ncbi:MAG TPA: sodium:calcium antiporter, partial [Phycisphaerae bacterium]|nr:sodium:calcium antiporter [Phycisphaerae bacterium]
MLDFASLSLVSLVLLFVAAAAVIGVVGTRLARIADALADATGWGEAFFGAVFLGASTSLPGVVTSVTAAWEGHAALAFSNALGGIAAQTVFLAVADMFYRKANLEHAAASVPNMMQGALLIVLLMAVLLLMSAPAVTVWSVHPGSVALV